MYVASKSGPSLGSTPTRTHSKRLQCILIGQTACPTGLLISPIRLSSLVSKGVLESAISSQVKGSAKLCLVKLV